MNPVLYYGLTLLHYALIIYLSIVINDIGEVFSFIATFAGTGMCFFLPSVLFCKAFTAYATDEAKEQNGIYYKLSIANFIVGIFLFGLFLASNIMAITAS